MTNKIQNQKTKYDLEERTSAFTLDVVGLLKEIPTSPINKPIITQLVRSSSSIGANYCEADACNSKKDFKHKISICKKEAKETRYWLRIIAGANPEQKEKCRKLWKESQELLLIFSSILNK